MTQALKTTGNRGLDSEIDRLWSEIRSLRAALAEAKGGSAQVTQAIYQTVINQTTEGGGGSTAGVLAITPEGGGPVTGYVSLSAGSNVTLVQSGQDIEISSSGGGGSGIPISNLYLQTSTYTIATPASDCIVVVKNDSTNNPLGNAIRVNPPTGYTWESWSWGGVLQLMYSEAVGIHLNSTTHVARVLWILRLGNYNTTTMSNQLIGSSTIGGTWVTVVGNVSVSDDMTLDGNLIVLDEPTGATIASGYQPMIPVTTPS